MIVPTNFSKLSISLLILLFVPSIYFAQCTNGTAYGNITAPSLGASATQGCTYASEYNSVNTVAAVNNYISSSTIGTDFITVRQGTFNGVVIASGTTPLNWISTAAGNYFIHINTDAACGTAAACRDITLTHVIPTVPMTYTSSTAIQTNTSDLDICATDAQIIGVEVVTSGSLTPLDLTQLILRTNGSTAPTADITNIDVYYTGTSSTFSTANLYGNAAPATIGTNIQINGTQTLAEGTNYFWIAYDINGTATIGNNIDAVCNQLTVDATNRIPTTAAPAGNRTLIACGRTCPTSATIFSDGFESGNPVNGVIPGTTYGSVWTGLVRTGTYHAWMNIVNGLSNVDVYERRFDNYYMGCDVTFDYWTLHNSIGFDADYILIDDNNIVIDFNNVVTTGADVNIYQNHSITFTPTTTGITLRIHSNSTGGSGNDIALDDFQITQCCVSTLPIVLLNFETTCENDHPLLNWTTVTEINNDYFTIERSPDMEHFEEITTINGKGNSSIQSTYQWIDTNPLNTTSYYRLKQTDFDGSSKYLGTTPINCFKEKAITIYPNPTSDNVTINFGTNHQNMKIEIKNILGQVIQSHSYKSIENIELPIDGENGIYFVTIFNLSNKEIYHQKIIKH